MTAAWSRTTDAPVAELDIEQLGEGWLHIDATLRGRISSDDIVAFATRLLRHARAAGADCEELEVAVALLDGSATVAHLDDDDDVVRAATVSWPLVLHTADRPCARGHVHERPCDSGRCFIVADIPGAHHARRAWTGSSGDDPWATLEYIPAENRWRCVTSVKPPHAFDRLDDALAALETLLLRWSDSRFRIVDSVTGAEVSS